MSRARVIVIGAALALFVYTGATTIDSWVGDLTRAFEWKGDSTEILDVQTGVGILNIPALVGFLLLLFGGLPLAVFGLLSDRHWAAREQRRYLRVPYAVLMLQIVSVLFSGFWLVVMVPGLLWALAEGFAVEPRDWFLPAYLSAQILAGTAAIPVWRRHIMHASVRRYKLLSL